MELSQPRGYRDYEAGFNSIFLISNTKVLLTDCVCLDVRKVLAGMKQTLLMHVFTRTILQKTPQTGIQGKNNSKHTLFTHGFKVNCQSLEMGFCDYIHQSGNLYLIVYGFYQQPHVVFCQAMRYFLLLIATAKSSEAAQQKRQR